MRAVLFSVEETLVPEQTPERWQWAWRPLGPVLPERHVRAALKRSLHAWDRRRWEGLVGGAPAVGAEAYREFLRSTLVEIAGHRLPEAETEAVVDRFLRAPVERPPPPDVPATLAGLRALGITLVAIGDRPGPSASENLKRAGIRPAVDLVVGEALDAPWPPSKEAFRAAAKAAGCRPSELAFVGHLYWSETRAAHRAGLPAYLLDRQGWWPRVEERRLSSLAELPALLTAPAAPAPPAPVGPSLAPGGG
jgi:FMN phosphatase YigB (HAD superfamily)